MELGILVILGSSSFLTGFRSVVERSVDHNSGEVGFSISPPEVSANRS
jgi:hypothetical protein